MRTFSISLSILLLVAGVSAMLDVTDRESFPRQKIQVGNKKCKCNFNIDADGNGGCSRAVGGCEKKCTGNAEVELGDFIFTMDVEKGEVSITSCISTGQGTGAGSGTGSGPKPPTGPGAGSGSGSGSGSGTGSGTGSGSGAGSGTGSGPQPPTRPTTNPPPRPTTGSGSGTGSGPRPTIGPGPGSGSGSGPQPPTGSCPNITCPYGFTKVCPMDIASQSCPADMKMVCPGGEMATAGRSLEPNRQSSNNCMRGCQCVPNFLMALVPEIKFARMLYVMDRESFPRQKIKVGKKKCKCNFNIDADGDGGCSRAVGGCDKKCTGNAEVELGDFKFTMDVEKGKVTITECISLPSITLPPMTNLPTMIPTQTLPPQTLPPQTQPPPVTTMPPTVTPRLGCSCVAEPSVVLPSAGPPTVGPTPTLPTAGPTGVPPTVGPTVVPSTVGPTGVPPTVGPTGVPTTTESGSAVETTLRIVQTWSQETDYERTAEISIPARTAGQKFPVVIDIHGFGGQGNLQRMGSFLGDDCIIVAPNGYERSWNILSEASKAPDVEFIQLLIQKVGEDYPQAADLSDVTIIGTSNGAALIYRLLIEVENPRPFKRVIPMVSSMINKQYNNNQFWKPSCDDCGEVSNFDTPVVPSSPGPEIIHIHGTNDGTVPYLGGGGAFLGDDVDFIGAQENDYLFAKAFGFDGLQLDDNAGTEVVDGMLRYSYTTANGEVSHYKLVDGTHNGFGAPYTNDVKDTIKNAILG